MAGGVWVGGGGLVGGVAPVVGGAGGWVGDGEGWAQPTKIRPITRSKTAKMKVTFFIMTFLL